MAINGLKKTQPANNDMEELQAEAGDLSSTAKKSNGNFNKIVMWCVVGAVLLLVVLSVVYFTKGGDKEPSSETGTDIEASADVEAEDTSSGGDKPWLSASSGEESVSEEPVVVDKVGRDTSNPSDKIVPGIKDVETDKSGVNHTNISADTYTKDINAKDIKENYTIDGIETIIDFVSYTKKRATTDVGIELYWLDAVYKGKKAKIQVPFSIFKELDPVGVTVVDVEVVTIDDGSNSDDLPQVVTGFTVRPDYKRILEENKED